MLVTHDIREAARLGRTITFMSAGRVVQQGTFADLVERPASPFVRQFLTAPSAAPSPELTVRASSRRARASLIAALSLARASRAGAGAQREVIRVGSKSFTESYILAEIVAQVIEQVGEARAERRWGWAAPASPTARSSPAPSTSIPSTPGTLAARHPEGPRPRRPSRRSGRASRRAGSRSAPRSGSPTPTRSRSAPTQARAPRAPDHRRPARHPELRAAFSSGFLERDDGWPGLRARYGLGLARVEVMEHALTYRAIASGQVDVMDVFSTDGQLERLRLRLLEDDRRFFPDYSAVLLARRG